MVAVPLVVTGDMVSDRLVAWVFGGRSPEVLRAMGRRAEEALDAVLPEKRTRKQHVTKDGDVIDVQEVQEGGAPDHGNRLRAAEDIADWHGLRGSRKLQPVEGDRTGELTVLIVSSQAGEGIGHPAETHGVAVRFRGSHGASP
jgi:hypothetical protein